MRKAVALVVQVAVFTEGAEWLLEGAIVPVGAPKFPECARWRTVAESRRRVGLGNTCCVPLAYEPVRPTS